MAEVNTILGTISRVTFNNSSSIYKIKDKEGRELIAPEYQKGNSYNAGDYFIYEDLLFYVTEDVTGNNNTSFESLGKKVVACTVSTELKRIENRATSAMDYIGEIDTTKTIIKDGLDVNPIYLKGITDPVEPQPGDVVLQAIDKAKKEFIYSGKIWNEFGDAGSLGKLAFVDEAVGTFTIPSLTVTPTLTKAAVSDAVSLSKAKVDINASYTPSGTIKLTEKTANAGVNDVTFTPTGTVSTPTITVKPKPSIEPFVSKIETTGKKASMSLEIVPNTEILNISFSPGTEIVSSTNVTTVPLISATATSSKPTLTMDPIIISAAFNGSAGKATQTDAQVKGNGDIVANKVVTNVTASTVEKSGNKVIVSTP